MYKQGLVYLDLSNFEDLKLDESFVIGIELVEWRAKALELIIKGDALLEKTSLKAMIFNGRTLVSDWRSYLLEVKSFLKEIRNGVVIEFKDLVKTRKGN